MKSIEKQTKDATAEMWGKALEDAGCPEFMLIIHQKGRISVGCTLPGPVMLQVMDTLKEQAQAMLLHAREVGERTKQ